MLLSLLLLSSYPMLILPPLNLPYRCPQSLDDMSYLLSPQDLMALEQLPQMVAAGVSCFKIEGRLKGPEYVAATTAAYRAGVDAAWEQYLQQQQQQVTPSSQRHSSANSDSSNSSNSSRIAPEVLSAMAQVFSRAQDEAYGGLTPGFLEGSRHQRLVRGRAPRHRGLCLGRIAGAQSCPAILVVHVSFLVSSSLNALHNAGLNAMTACTALCIVYGVE